MNLEQLGNALGLAVHGNRQQQIEGIAPIDSAGPDDLSFVVGARYLKSLARSQAGAVIVPASLLEHAPGNALQSDNPYASYAKASWLLYPPRRPVAGIHPTASVHPDAMVAPSASVGEFVVIGAHTIIDDDVVIGAHSIVGSDTGIKSGTCLMPRVMVGDRVQMGHHCRVQSGAVIGSEGFGYAWSGDGWLPIQQIGGVVIGDRVHIGANTTIDCGAIEPTLIEDGVILDNQIQIAHNVSIGRNTAIAGCVGIAGSTRIGSHCQIGGACNIVGHLNIADHVVINAASLVARSITCKGRYGSGMPLQEEHVWKRNFVNLGKLEQWLKRIRLLELSIRDRQSSRPDSSD